MICQFNASTQLRLQLVFQVGDDFTHDFVNLLVVERGILVLEEEAYRIALLACFEVLAFIDVEQGDFLQELLPLR